jgi:hypothetical protein
VVTDASVNVLYPQPHSVQLERTAEPIASLYQDRFTVSSNSVAEVSYIQLPADASTASVSSISLDDYSLHFARLLEVHRNPDTWPHGADGPAQIASRWASHFLHVFRSYGLEPTRVSASVEGGVAISFVKNGKYADVECLNSGEILAVTYEKNGAPDVWQVSLDSDNMALSASRIRKFILG